MAAVDDGLVYNDPNFGVIWSFIEKFGELCGISPELTITNLQLMLEDTRNVHQDLIDLHIKLLRKSGKKNVPPDKWEKAIVKFCHSYSKVDAWEIERFGYKKSKLNVKLVLLKRLLESQFDGNSKFKTEINKLSADDLRLLPIGRDIKGKMYWFHQDRDLNLRIYREDQDDETWEVIVKERDELVALISNLENHASPKKEEVSTTPSDTGESKDGEMSLSNSLTIDCKSDVKVSGECLQFVVPESLKKSNENEDNIFIKPEILTSTETSIKLVSVKHEDLSFKIEEETVCCQDDLKGIDSRLPLTIKTEPMDLDIKEEKIEEDKNLVLKSFTNALCHISPNSTCNRENTETKDQEASQKTDSELSVVVRESVIRIAEKICINESLKSKVCDQPLSENRFDATDFSLKTLDSTAIQCYSNSASLDDVSSNLKSSSSKDCHLESVISCKSHTESFEHASERKRMPLKKREIPKNLDTDTESIAANSDLGIVDNKWFSASETTQSNESKTSGILLCDEKKSNFNDNVPASKKTKDEDFSKTQSVENKEEKEQSNVDSSENKCSSNLDGDKSEQIELICKNENNSQINTNSEASNSSITTYEKISSNDNCSSSLKIESTLKSAENKADAEVCKKLDNEDSPNLVVKESIENSERNVDQNNSDKQSDLNTVIEHSDKPKPDQLQTSIAKVSEPELIEGIGDERNELERKSELGAKEHSKSLEKSMDENKEITDTNGILPKVKNNFSIGELTTNNKTGFTLEKSSIENSITSVVVVETKNNDKENAFQNEKGTDMQKCDSSKIYNLIEISKDCSNKKELIEEKSNSILNDSQAIGKDVHTLSINESNSPLLLSEVNAEQLNSSVVDSVQMESAMEIDRVLTASEVSCKDVDALKNKEITEEESKTKEDKLVNDEVINSETSNKDKQDVICPPISSDDDNLKESSVISKFKDSQDLTGEKLSSQCCTFEPENESLLPESSEFPAPKIDNKLNKNNESSKGDKIEPVECENRKSCANPQENNEDLNDTSCKSQEKLTANEDLEKIQTEDLPVAPKKRKRKSALSDLGPIENLPVKRSPRLQAQRLKYEDQQRKVETDLQKHAILTKKTLAEERKQKRAAKAQKEEIVALATITNGKVSKKRGRPKKKTEEKEIPVTVLSKKKRVRKRRSKHHLKRKKPAIVSRKKKRSNNPWETSSGSSYSSSEADGAAGEDEEGFEEEDEELVFNDKSDHEFSPESESEENSVQPQTIKRARTVKKEKIDSDSECSIGGDDKPCNKCSKQDHPEWILLCDKCDSGYHTSCLRPPLMVIPDGDWFCPPCCHVLLLEKLNEQLKIFDQLWKKKDREEMRKKRLAYVGISLDNVLKPEKERRDTEEEQDEEQEEESEDDSIEEDKEYVQVRKRSRRARKEVSYRFKEYDELIKSAIHEEAPQVIEIKEPAGKDISNTDCDKNEMNDQKENEDNKDESDETEDDDDDHSRKKKKHKRLNDLNSSSSEEQDNDSDEDFQQSSANSEQSEDSFGAGEESDNSWNNARSGRSRVKYGRRDNDFVDDGSDDSYDSSRRKGRRAATKTVNYREVSESDDEDGRSKKKSRQLYSRPYREPRESDNDSDWRKPSKRSRFQSSPKSNKRFGKMWRLESDDDESDDEDNHSRKFEKKSVTNKRESNRKPSRMRMQDFVRKSEEEEESSSSEESENSNDDKDEEIGSEDTECEVDKMDKQCKSLTTDPEVNATEVLKSMTKNDSKLNALGDDIHLKATEFEKEKDTSLASEDKNFISEKGERGKQSQPEFLERPTPLHPSVLDAYSVRSSPSKLTLLDNYSSRSSPQSLTPLELYPPSPSTGIVPPYDRDRPPRPPLAHQIPPLPSNQFHGEYDNYPGQYYPPSYPPHGNQFTSSPPASGYQSPPSAYPSYQQPSPNYGFVPQPYSEQGLYQGQGPHYGPTYPNYSPPPPPSQPPPPPPPPPATTTSSSTSQSQPNGRFSIDNLLQRRIEGSEDDEFSSVNELVSYITGSHDNPL